MCRRWVPIRPDLVLARIQLGRGLVALPVPWVVIRPWLGGTLKLAVALGRVRPVGLLVVVVRQRRRWLVVVLVPPAAACRRPLPAFPPSGTVHRARSLLTSPSACRVSARLGSVLSDVDSDPKRFSQSRSRTWHTVSDVYIKTSRHKRAPGRMVLGHFLRSAGSPGLPRALARSLSSALPAWATCDPHKQELGKVLNVVEGEWVEIDGPDRATGGGNVTVVDPMNGKAMAEVNEVSIESLHRYVACLDTCPKSGLHNPLKNPERYLMYGNVCSRVAEALNDPQVESYFTDLIIRVAPKSRPQALGEVQVCGDNVRFLCKSFVAPGDYAGQRTEGMRWPFGKVALITPFNFPLEIPALQLMGALFMGNKPVLKVDTKVSVVMSEFLKLLNHCGMPLSDLCFINCDGGTMHELLMR